MMYDVSCQVYVVSSVSALVNCRMYAVSCDLAITICMLRDTGNNGWMQVNFI